MPRAVVISNFSRAGVGDAHFRQPDFFHVLDRRKVSKVRVEEIVGLSGIRAAVVTPRSLNRSRMTASGFPSFFGSAGPDRHA